MSKYKTVGEMIKAGDYEALKNNLESRNEKQLAALEEIGNSGLRDIDALLFYAMDYKNDRMMDVLELLVSYGADPKVEGANQITLLMKAATANNVAAINFLVTQPDINLNARDAGGFLSAAHYAVTSNSVDAFNKLVEAGVDPHYIDPISGKTYLHYAAYECNAEMVDALIALKVDPTIEDAVDTALASEMVQDTEEFIPLFEKLEEYRKSVAKNSTGFEL